MGATCSRKNGSGWQALQVDLADLHSDADSRHSSTSSYDNMTVHEVELERARASRHPGRIETACDQVEARRLVKPERIAAARAEAQWIRAQMELEEAARSGDAARLDLARQRAQHAGLSFRSAPATSPASGRSDQLTPHSKAFPASSPEVPMCSMQGLAALVTAKATMCVALSVLIYEWSAYNIIFLRKILPALGKELMVIPLGILFNTFWGLSMFSFVKAHITDPGNVPPRWYEWIDDVGDVLPVAPARLEWQPGKATLCKRCERPRPERAHHCHVCNRCVMRMDHHCPWINNCVGFRNHKFFLLVVSYCLLTSVVALATSMEELVSCAQLLVSAAVHREWKADVTPAEVVVFLIYGLLALLFVGLLTPMAMTHTELATYNVTTIEGHYNNSNMPNPFDQGTSLDNFAQIFGSFGWDWFLPISPAKPLSDGIVFPRSGELLDFVGRRTKDVRGQEWFDERTWRVRYRVRNRDPSPGQTDVEKQTSSSGAGISRWLLGSREVSVPPAKGRRPSNLGTRQAEVLPQARGRVQASAAAPTTGAAVTHRVLSI